jgi:hypothetical protein
VSNVIDFTSRKKVQGAVQASSEATSAEVLNIADLRSKIISEDRRQVKRTILTEFIAMHIIVPNFGVMKVALYDITEHGVSFDLPLQHGRYNVGDNVEMRIYMNQQTYFKIQTKVAHVTEVSDEGISRHGCEFLAESTNMEALSHFVKFLECVTANLRRDSGDVLVTKINS